MAMILIAESALLGLIDLRESELFAEAVVARS